MDMELLDASQYRKAADALHEIGFNTLFARTVVEGHNPGNIFVDDVKKPSTFFIAHSYGMSLLFGSTDNLDFNDCLRDYILDVGKARKRPEWLQIHPASWKPVLENLLGQHLVRKQANMNIPAVAAYEPDKVMEYTRVNFRFNGAKYSAFKASMAKHHKIIRTDEKIFTELQGTVIPKYFWRDAGHFMKDGVGFTLIHNGEPASTAFCAFMGVNQLEIGIETMEKYRGLGLSQYVCSALIDYSLENGFEPIWSCRLENTASYRMAQKLGFEPTHYLPYYLLVSHP
jgi:RimJ/RimL family protein N-acetyltransferase